jgi:general secretion pathway protein F
LREWLRWRVPAFREDALARIARVMSLLLDRAVPLPEAVALVEQLETGNVVQQELRMWRHRLSQGVARFTEVAANGRAFPPLFVWLAANAGATLAQGFRKAADIYRARANARSDILLHAALPVAVLMLGLLIASQASLMLSGLVAFMQMLGDMSEP